MQGAIPYVPRSVTASARARCTSGLAVLSPLGVCTGSAFEHCRCGNEVRRAAVESREVVIEPHDER
jgi:hypothetical protein